MNRKDSLIPVRALLQAWSALASTGARGAGKPSRLRVLLECDARFEKRLRSDVDFVRYVRDRKHADVCVSVTRERSRRGTSHYVVRFVGTGRFRLIEASARIDPDQGHTAGSRPHGDGDRSTRSTLPTSASVLLPSL